MTTDPDSRSAGVRGLVRYVSTLHRTYIDLIETYIADPAARASLDRYSRLPTDVVYYRSLTDGAGYEYVERGAGRAFVSTSHLDEMLWRCPTGYTRDDPMIRFADTDRTTVSGLKFRGGFPLRFDRSSGLRLIRLHGEGRGWARDISFAELSDDGSLASWSPEAAVTQAAREALTAVTELQIRTGPERLGSDIALQKRGSVLLLGDFSPAGRARLDAIATKLREAGYDPMLLDDVPDIPELDLRQKVSVVGQACRFVVMDDSSRSGHDTEFPIVESDRLILAQLHREDGDPTAMTAGGALLSRAIREWSYTDASLPIVLGEVVEWAEGLLAEIGAANEAFYERLRRAADTTND